MRVTGQNEIRVVLNKGPFLGIAVVNSPWKELPVDQRRAKALEIARLAYNGYRSRPDVNGVIVTFAVHRRYLGVFSYDDSTDAYRLDVSGLTTDRRNWPPAIASKLLFVPVGDAPTSEINALVVYYREKFGIEAQVLPPISLQPGDVDVARRQLIAENVIESLLRVIPQYANTSAVLIGITRQDMFPRSMNWQFCFGSRIWERRVAVVSTARMGLHYVGEPPTEASISSRLRKMVTKDIGVMYYGMRPNANPRSVLFNDILGLQELDQVSEYF